MVFIYSQGMILRHG